MNVILHTVHATCYEKATKLLVLQTVNAYWDKQYYDINKKTITKVRGSRGACVTVMVCWLNLFMFIMLYFNTHLYIFIRMYTDIATDVTI